MISCLLGLASLLTAITSTSAQPLAPYARAGWEADMFQARSLNARATATIIDAQTIRLSHFDYAGGISFPGIYIKLATNVIVGTTNLDQPFLQGVRISEELLRRYFNETVILKLPEGLNLDNYPSISIYCEPVPLNLAWGNFAPPVAPTLEVIPVEGPEIAIFVTGPRRRLYRLEATEDPSRPESWQTVMELMNDDVAFTYLDSLTNTARFYRAVRD